MNGEKLRKLSNKELAVVSLHDAATSTSNPFVEDDRAPRRSTYDSFFWLCSYFAMFMKRLGKDLFQSFLYNVYSERVLPDHIADLMSVHKRLRIEREEHLGTYSRYQFIRRGADIRTIKAFKSHILCSEDDNNVPFTFRTDITAIPNIERDPLFIFNSCNISEPSSEILIDPKKTKTQTVLRKNYDTKVRHADGPSTSKEHPLEVIRSLIIYDSDSSDELQMMDINLQSENEIPVDDPDNEHESIVLAYLKNKDVLLDIEGTILSTKKKSSILESVPKMETIIEGEQFYTFRPDDNDPILNKESSDTKEETNEPPHNISQEKEK